MTRHLVLPIVALLAACGSSPEEQKPDGAENYALNCAGCHNPGPGHPGTMLLEQLGRPVPSLIGRADLEYDYVHSIVRQGLIEMPPFRPTELSDDEIRLIFDYIKAAKSPAPNSASTPVQAP